MSKVVIIGANGTIGSAIADRLGGKHEVVRVGLKEGDHTVDLASKKSIEDLFSALGEIDAVVCAAGLSKFGTVEEASDEDFRLGSLFGSRANSKNHR